MTGFEVQTQGRAELVDITAGVEAAVRAAGVREGACLVFVPHTTAGVTLNECCDPAVRADILRQLERLVPDDISWSHAEGNSPAHVKASLLGSSLWVPVSGGRLALGTWQGILLGEFDGPRRRRVLVEVIPVGPQGARGLVG